MVSRANNAQNLFSCITVFIFVFKDIAFIGHIFSLVLDVVKIFYIYERTVRLSPVLHILINYYTVHTHKNKTLFFNLVGPWCPACSLILLVSFVVLTVLCLDPRPLFRIFELRVSDKAIHVALHEWWAACASSFHDVWKYIYKNKTARTTSNIILFLIKNINNFVKTNNYYSTLNYTMLNAASVKSKNVLASMYSKRH